MLPLRLQVPSGITERLKRTVETTAQDLLESRMVHSARLGSQETGLTFGSVETWDGADVTLRGVEGCCEQDERAVIHAEVGD